MSSEIYEDILAMIGQESGKIEAEDEVNEAMIRHWCEAMEDANPLYTEPEYARTTKYGGIVAPPQMVQAYSSQRLWPKLDSHSNPLAEAVEKLDKAGYFGVVATSTSQEYFAIMRPGDHISYNVRLNSVSSEKATRLGRGYFITANYSYTNQTDTLVCRQLFTILKFKPTT